MTLIELQKILGDRIRIAENFNPENLYPINRRIHAYMSRNRLWSKDAELTKTAILLANLKVQLSSGGLKRC